MEACAREREVPRGFELRSLDSESRVLTVTPRDQVTFDQQEMQNLHHLAIRTGGSPLPEATLCAATLSAAMAIQKTRPRGSRIVCHSTRQECVVRAAWGEPLHSACASAQAKCAPRANMAMAPGCWHISQAWSGSRRQVAALAASQATGPDIQTGAVLQRVDRLGEGVQGKTLPGRLELPTLRLTASTASRSNQLS